MILGSGQKIELKLKSGDCKPSTAEEEITEEATTQTTTTETSSDTTTQLITEENRRNSVSFEELQDSWMPILPSASFKNATAKSEEKTVLEPVVLVKPKRETENRTRSSDKRSFEVVAPVEVKVKKKVKTRTEENQTENKSIMVQLFPIRIASMFEKAERYARQTILPYLTEQFPTFFKPTLNFDADNDTNVIEDSRFFVDTLETVKPEKRAFKSTSARARRKIDKLDDYIHTYKNLSGVRGVFHDKVQKNVTSTIKVEQKSITNKNETDDITRVDLPTFKPPSAVITTRIPKYIPLERRS